MADDGYTTIFRTTDAAQGGLVAEMLQGEGIDARFHSINTALIGLHGGLIEMELTVPIESEAQALELLADLEYVGAAEAVDQGQDVGSDDVDEVAAPAAASRWRALARAGFTLFLPGTCHLYAGRPWTAVVLALAASWCISGAIAAENGSTRFDMAVATIFAIVLGDTIQGVRAAAAELRGVRASVARQVVAGVVLAVVAGLLGLGASTAIAAPGRWRAHVLKRFNVKCTRSGVVFESADTDDRDLFFHRLGVAVPVAAGTEEIYDTRLDARSAVRLRAGATARTPFALDETRAAVCARAGGCRIVFEVMLTATERGPLPLQARGECTPGWGDSSDEVPGRLELVNLKSAGE
jgi:hypothetical protein